MRKIVLFIATSLDGFVARRDGSIDWLFSEGDFGYEAFMQTVDTTLMGGVTYREVLGFGAFPYAGRENYVFTRHPQTMPAEHVTFITEDIPAFVRQLKERPGKTIWLIGGGQINTILLRAGLIDEMMVFVHPVLLGDGIALFAPPSPEAPLRLRGVRQHERGLVQLDYGF